jgi:hypothetical protein
MRITQPMCIIHVGYRFQTVLHNCVHVVFRSDCLDSFAKVPTRRWATFFAPPAPHLFARPMRRRRFALRGRFFLASLQMQNFAFCTFSTQRICDSDDTRMQWMVDATEDDDHNQNQVTTRGRSTTEHVHEI